MAAEELDEDETRSYAVCPMCGYKNTIITTGTERFKVTVKKILFNCLGCGAPLAPHDDKEAFERAPLAPSQSEPRLKVQKKDGPSDPMDS